MSTPPGGPPPYDPNQPQDPNQGYGAPPPPPPGGGGSYPSYPSDPAGGGYGQPPYNQPQYGGQPGGGSQTNGLAIASLVTGILGIPLVCCWVGVLLSIAAVVTGFMGKKKADESGGRVGGRGMALAGIILGVIGIVLMVVLVILVVATGSFDYTFDTDSM